MRNDVASSPSSQSIESISWLDMSNRAQNIPLYWRNAIEGFAHLSTWLCIWTIKSTTTERYCIAIVLDPKLNAIRRSRFHKRGVEHRKTETCEKRILFLYSPSIDERKEQLRLCVCVFIEKTMLIWIYMMNTRVEPIFVTWYPCCGLCLVNSIQFRPNRKFV